MKFQHPDIASFKKKALQWASSFEVCCYLDSNSFADKYSNFDCLIAAGVKHEFHTEIGSAFEKLEKFKSQHPKEWLNGFFTYELKDELENLTSSNLDNLGFPGLYFFVPQYLIILRGDEIEIVADDADDVIETINNLQYKRPKPGSSINVNSRLSKEEYIFKVNQIKDHITRGDIYVTNFCQEFYVEDADIDPVETFAKLNDLSPNPFACFFKHYKKYIICASPERFLAKRGTKLISQPIKGTAPRGSSEVEDNILKRQLITNIKEQQENVMVVDMVRNDLTRCAKPGTVEVEELFELYSFNHVHQMISTVTCEIAPGISPIDTITSTFPMGSMTGAPKVNAMRLMENYEVSKRGEYSGAVGYFAPDGDFDFNVIIRTILYNAQNRYLSFHAGSAITHSADAEAEYEECLLKTAAIRQVLQLR